MKGLPRYFFRFRSNFEFYEKELTDQYIWTSDVEMLNDPLEGYLVKPKLWDRLSFSHPGKTMGTICDFQLHNSSELHEYICSNHDHSDPLQKIFVRGKLRHFFSNIEQRNQYLSHVKIACFTPNVHNILMWIHYAKNFEGICFCYSKSHISNLCDDNHQISFDKVKYTNKIPTKILIDDNHSLLKTKSKFWKYEGEFRLINQSAEQKIKLPIHSIIVGYRNTRLNEINDLSLKILNQNVFVALPCEESGSCVIVSYQIFQQEQKLFLQLLDEQLKIVSGN